MTSTPFLKEIAHILLHPGEYDLPSTCIVFPNKRARLYLSKYIGELTTGPVWAPQYYTISELMEQLSGSIIADRLTLIFELYAAYSKVTGSNESFDTFYPYSETLLADFDEIDKYMVDADDLFQNLSGLKSLDGRFNYLSDEQLAHIQRFWKTFNVEKPAGGQSLFISLWDALPGVYHDFNSRLSASHIAYEGMAYRKALLNAENDLYTFDPMNKFLFVGFNALNVCEEKLFSLLKKKGKAEFFWDYDSWYTNSEIHEAGFFIRKNLKNFPQTKITSHEHLSHDKSNILFVPVYSNSGQASVIPSLLDRMNIMNGTEAESTALVLADEALLMPVLYAIPASIKEINVTMGYPVAGSAVYSMIDSLYELLKNARKNTEGAASWYFQDVLALMGNPMLKVRYAPVSGKVRNTAISQHKVYLTEQDIFDSPAEDLIFNNNDHTDICGFVLEVITSVIRELPADSHSSGITDPVRTELLFQVYTFLSRLQDVLQAHKSSIPGNDVLFRLIRKMIRSMHIPFSGEPLAGIQLLGILETRTLDFENVIVLSANEGVLPAPADKPSFIPYNLRAGFGLPTPEHHDAIYAYYFYRLIQRSRNIALVYDASSAGMKTGERSRFLHQLFYEMKLPIQELKVQSSVAQIKVKPVIIEKKGDVEAALNNYFGEHAKVLSPSAINEYFDCPIRFCFHHVLGLPQAEEITDEIDSRIFGNILHSALKNVYDAFGVEVVTEQKLNNLLENENIIQEALDKAFTDVLSGKAKNPEKRIPEGYNLIIRQVIFAYILQFIRTEINNCPFTVVGLEERYQAEIQLKIQGRVEVVRVGGIIDRIDRQGNITRILDYKTGAVKDKFTSIESLFESPEKRRNDAAFQVLLYSWVYSELHPGDNLVPGLIFFRESHSGSFSTSIEMGKETLNDFLKVKQEFGTRLKAGLEVLFNYDIPFEQTSLLQICQYCPYKLICRRE